MLLILTCLCFYTAAALAQVSNINVTIAQGVVVGSRANDGNYYIFEGLPYAGNVDGENRFKVAPPPPNFPGVFHAVHRNTCLQPSPSGNGLTGVENCLALNIHTPNVTNQSPVLVVLLGEDYTYDDATNSYSRLVTEGVVVVTMNYRLSIFGFLCLGVEEAPGNAGLKDIVQGLNWIKTNIGAFGGDPNSVTLFGHGSAAAMTDLITMSPLATNLVHKVIVQSGSAIAPWAIAYDPIGHANIVAGKLGYGGKNPKELAEHLAATEIQLFATVLENIRFPNSTVLFAPCIENKNLNNTFLAEAPIELLRKGNYSHIPYIAGYTNKEGTIRAAEAASGVWLQQMQTNFSQFIPVDIDQSKNSTLSGLIREFYFDKKNVDLETIQDYLDYIGDSMILVPVIRGALERASTSTAEVRLYEFAYRGTVDSDWIYKQIPLIGAKHGAVLRYLFNYDLLSGTEAVRQSLIARYVSFVKTGQPTYIASAWNPFTNSSQQYLHYSGEPITPYEEIQKSNPHSQKMATWRDIYDKYYIPPRPVSSSYSTVCFFYLVLLSQIFLNYLI